MAGAPSQKNLSVLMSHPFIADINTKCAMLSDKTRGLMKTTTYEKCL